MFTNPVHLDVKPGYPEVDCELPEKSCQLNRPLPWSAPATLILRFLKDARRDMIGFALYAETEATRNGKEGLFDSHRFS